MTLPNYDIRPLLETSLGVQFDRLPAFRNAHLGAFWKALELGEWPIVQDVAILPSQFERFGGAARWAEGWELQPTQDAACRLQITNCQKTRMIQLQNTRLQYNWLRESGDTYPRFDAVVNGFRCSLEKLIDFAKQEALGELRLNQWEVTFVNQIPQGSVWNNPCDWRFFRPLAGFSAADTSLEMESFGGEWRFIIPERKGRLHIQWLHGVKFVSGHGEQEIVRLMFTARGPIDESQDQVQALFDGLSVGHTAIDSSFRELMSEDAQCCWGIKNVHD